MNAEASGLASRWAKLPTAGRIAVVTAPVVVIVLIIAASLGHPFRDDRSWNYGSSNEVALSAQVYYRNIGSALSQSSDEAKRMSCQHMVELNEPEGIDTDDAVAGCLAAAF